jgi:hypothetical protein
VFVPGNPFQYGLMFVGKAGANPSEAPFRCSTLGWAPGLTHKHYTKLLRLARDKNSSFIRTFVNYGHEKFDRIGPRRKYFTIMVTAMLNVNKLTVIKLTVIKLNAIA